MLLKLCAPTLFGLEGMTANELKHLGFKNVAAENGRVRFEGDELGLAKANICSRFSERILIELAHFKAMTFDELFEGTKAAKWETFIPKTGRFPVKGYSLNSALHSVPDCQRIIKKAISARLGGKYGLTWLPESGEEYQVQFSIMKDEVYLSLDTSGVGLHKRGYRPAQVQAPLRETLAAALVDMAGYRGREDFCDPFCGSGTIAIEAALSAKRRAPGINRSFSAENWHAIDYRVWTEAREEARAREFQREYRIFASDIDPEAIEISRKNAARAGVADIIDFSVADATWFQRRTESGIIVTNPPYGERMLDEKEAHKLVHGFGLAMKKLENWSVTIITSDEELEHHYGRRADKVRKLYNGMIKCGAYYFKG